MVAFLMDLPLIYKVHYMPSMRKHSYGKLQGQKGLLP
jgi:hypothetical protein